VAWFSASALLAGAGSAWAEPCVERASGPPSELRARGTLRAGGTKDQLTSGAGAPRDKQGRAASSTRKTLCRPQRNALSSSERRALLNGQTVSRPLAFERAGGRYIGGVSYQVLRASPEEVLATLQSVEQLPHALPRTKNARLVAAKGRTAHVELTQGNAFVEATYTVRLVRDRGSDELRFWLDHSRPHDIDDVWGFFRVEHFGRGQSLVTVAVALDLGPGIARMLFEGKVQRLILQTPRHIRDFVEPKAYAALGR